MITAAPNTTKSSANSSSGRSGKTTSHSEWTELLCKGTIWAFAIPSLVKHTGSKERVFFLSMILRISGAAVAADHGEPHVTPELGKRWFQALGHVLPRSLVDRFGPGQTPAEQSGVHG